MKFISGSSNLSLTKSIADKLGLPIIDCQISKFGNKEKRVWIKDKVRGENVTLVQSFSHNVDEVIIESLLIVDALERAGAKEVNLVVPWMGYSFQDKVFRSGEPIAAKVVANIISNSYVKRVFLLDLHNKSIPGFFSIPTDHVSALDKFVDYVKENFDLENTIAASPDFGGLKRAKIFANELGLQLANVDKRRDLETGKVIASNLYGQVKGKIILIFDDCIMSGRTVVEIAKFLKENEAKEVHFFATHAVFCSGAIEKIDSSQVDSVVVTNSIYHHKINDKIKTIDIGDIFAEALEKWL